MLLLSGLWGKAAVLRALKGAAGSHTATQGWGPSRRPSPWLPKGGVQGKAPFPGTPGDSIIAQGCARRWDSGDSCFFLLFSLRVFGMLLCREEVAEAAWPWGRARGGHRGGQGQGRLWGGGAVACETPVFIVFFKSLLPEMTLPQGIIEQLIIESQNGLA